MATFLNTLGVAYYRVGNYEKALARSCARIKINKTQTKALIPADLAFLAMTQQQTRPRQGSTGGASALCGSG